MKINFKFQISNFKLKICILYSIFLLCNQANAGVVDKVVAIVNDSVITLSDLNTAASIKMDDLQKIGKPEEKKRMMETKSKALDQLIERKLVEQASNKAGITVSEREIDNAIDDVKKQNNLNQDALLRALAANGLTFKEYRSQLKDQIRQMKFVSKEFRSKITVADDDIEAYYKQNIERFYEPVTIRISQIFLAVPRNITDMQKQDIEQKAKDILMKIRQGEDFAKLALAYSQGPNPENGGDLGFLKVGEIDPTIEKIALNLKSGETSGIIPTKLGLFIIQVTEKKEKEPKPFETVKNNIKNILFQNIVDERFKLWLEEQKSISLIEVNL
ncbi:MAG: peptidylprolyl isomerase [Deltaproteobacteria bacterium]|nr:peptidylprolyl isomerase [Deltaproteobacteria bacterium]